MARTTRERIAEGLDLLKQGLAPFVERELKQTYREQWMSTVRHDLGGRGLQFPDAVSEWDSAALLGVMWKYWSTTFERTLGRMERNLVAEVREVRNQHAHEQNFSYPDTQRALDSMARLLRAVSASEAEILEARAYDALQVYLREQTRTELRRASTETIASGADGRLRPWREVVTPHPDVAGGTFERAQFAADLWKVWKGEASAEYQDPADFYGRTYITEGIRFLLSSALKRLSGKGGDPVTQLQTNFGGGKTHSMLALYHLASGTPLENLPGLEPILEETGIRKLESVARVVLVGTRIDPGTPSVKADGTATRTLWGELAWQLGFARGGLEEAVRAFDIVKGADERGTSPGEALNTLIRTYSPCLILVDEWVAYARQLHEENPLPGGTFETQFTFAQTLTETVSAIPSALLVVSLPASDVAEGSQTDSDSDLAEVGGQRGREALHRLRNVIGRIDSPWRSATQGESYEIVRRRLFNPIVEREHFQARDATARAFYEMYRDQRQEFPARANRADYENLLRQAYPIHPELFDRLYNDWGSLVKFQRTRGVLRLMAAVIHILWERQDPHPMILPSMVPIDVVTVRDELNRYLEENWIPVVEKDVDGENSTSLELDRANPNLGRYSATRRVSRTLFIGSGPTHRASNRGLDVQDIRLGCALPGESAAIFIDALNRLRGEATYLYEDNTRYWYSTQPSLNSLADDEAERLRQHRDTVEQEIKRRLNQELEEKGKFSRVQAVPENSGAVPDERTTRLVVLGPEQLHTRGNAESPARQFAQEILRNRGNSPRLYANSLVFVAPDAGRHESLEEAVRRYLAWSTILQNQEEELTPAQVRTAESRRNEFDRAVNSRLRDTWCWLLVPEQEAGASEITWNEIRMQAQDTISARVSRRMVDQDASLWESMGFTHLKHYLDQYLWRGNHVQIRTLLDDFARFLYLPRLARSEVLLNTISDGLSFMTWRTDSFAYAEAFDEKQGRYLGLRAGSHFNLLPDDRGVLVRPEVADHQLQREQPEEPEAPRGEESDGAGTPVDPTTTVGDETNNETPPAAPVSRFYGTVKIDALRLSRDAGRLSDEVIQHLTGLLGSEVEVTLEIQAHCPDGIPDDVIRTVTENCNTLRFAQHGFEEDR